MQYVKNNGFEVRGHYVPPFKLESGKLIRVYIPNFSERNAIMGFDLAVELIEIFRHPRIDKNLIIREAIPYASNYSQNFFTEKISPITVERYLSSQLKVTKEETKSILSELRIERTRKLATVSFAERKYITIRGLFCARKAILFDYFGIGVMSMELIDKLIKTELDKGKCAIGFDNLQYMEKSEPFENIERIIINSDSNNKA